MQKMLTISFRPVRLHKARGFNGSVLHRMPALFSVLLSYFCLPLREEEIKKSAQGSKPFLYSIVAVDLKHLIGHLLKECIKPALQEPKSFTIFYTFLTVALKKGINGLKELMDLPGL